MYKVEIDISDWGISDDKVIVECADFDKVAIIQEFIEFQQENGWAVDYDIVEDEEEEDDDEVNEVNEDDEDEESEEYEIGEQVEDDDGVVWERVA